MSEYKILDAIKAQAKKSHARFHMPGHKGRKLKGVGLGYLKLDVTEVDGFDVLGAKRQAERDILNVYGAKECRILVDGATCGILSAVYAVKGLGDSLIINRNAHKSVYNALEICGINPVTVDTDGDFYSELDKAFCLNPNAVGALLTYPDYYGRCFSAERVKAITKKYGKLLLIDNAHGAHFKALCPKLYAGEFADVWVDGAHKSLSTVNQGALVFTANDALVDRLNGAVDAFSTTSPSYVIAHSVEYGVKNLLANSKKCKAVADRVDALKEKLKKYGVKILTSDDRLKMTVKASEYGRSAYQVQEKLSKKGIQLEMNDGENLLFMFSQNTTAVEIKRLYGAIIKALSEAQEITKRISETKKENPIRAMAYIDARKAETKTVLLADAVGKVSAVNAGLFPPCSPVVLAGEIITERTVKILLGAVGAFGVVNGRIKVIANED